VNKNYDIKIKRATVTLYIRCINQHFTDDRRVTTAMRDYNLRLTLFWLDIMQLSKL